MPKINLQVRLPEEVGHQIDEIAPKAKSAFVREAIEEKIRKEKYRQLEDRWIQALAEHPENLKETKKWLKAEGWGPR